MSLWSEIANDGDEILATFGRPVLFRNENYTVLIDQNPLEQVLGDGGFTYRSGFKVRMLIKENSALFFNLPQQGEQMIVFGREYTITTLTYRPPSPWVDLQVISTNQ